MMKRVILESESVPRGLAACAPVGPAIPSVEQSTGCASIPRRANVTQPLAQRALIGKALYAQQTLVLVGPWVQGRVVFELLPKPVFPDNTGNGHLSAVRGGLLRGAEFNVEIDLFLTSVYSDAESKFTLFTIFHLYANDWGPLKTRILKCYRESKKRAGRKKEQHFSKKLIAANATSR